MRTLRALNEELGTDYQPFEYYGHETPDAVLVAFGSVEASLSARVAMSMASSGSRIAVVTVRLYRPFAEDQLLKLIPRSARVVGVLGQVADAQLLQESGVHSQLYEDVLAALAYSSTDVPEVRELKYTRSEVWTPSSIEATLGMLLGKTADPSVTSSYLDEGCPAIHILERGRIASCLRCYVFGGKL